MASLKPFRVIEREGYEYAEVPMETMLKWMGLPSRFVGVEWALDTPTLVTGGLSTEPIVDQDLRTSLTWLSQWSREDGERVVVLTGPPGRGKSTYAAAVFRHARMADPSPLWANWPDVVAQCTDAWSDSGVSQGEILEPFVRASLLIIDDFGKELASSDKSHARDWQVRIAYEVINGRYQEERPILLTTELTPKTMAARFDQAITSRLLEHARWIDVSGEPDYRLGAR